MRSWVGERSRAQITAVLFPFDAGMHHAAQASPDDDVSFGDNFCSRVDIAQNNHMTCKFNACARTKCAFEEQGGLFAEIFYRKLTRLLRVWVWIRGLPAPAIEQSFLLSVIR